MWISKIWNKMFLLSYGYVYNFATSKVAHSFSEIAIKRMTLQLLDELNQIYPTEMSSRKYYILKDRILEGRDYVFVIIKAGNLSGYCCASDSPVYESGMRKDILVPLGSIYFFDDYIFKQYRGQGLQKASIIERLRLFLNEGYQRAFVVIHKGNVQSEKSYQNCGFIKESIYLSIRILKLVLKKKIRRRQL